jgi:DNA-binding CsgD family transcriptional regulator
MNKSKFRIEGVQRAFGGFGALLQVGLWLAELAEPGLLVLGDVYLTFSLLFVASSLFAFMAPVQPLLFFFMSPLQTATTLNSYFGLAFAAVAAIIVFRRGWFFRRPILKAALTSFLGSAFLAMPIVLSGQPGIAHASALISALLFCFLVFGLASRRVLSGLAPKKPVLRLSSYNLNRRQRQIAKARISGKSVKEIASELCLAESTVRNALSITCRELGVPGTESLLALGEQFRVE